MTKDKYGRKWDFPKNELCPVCRQPDSCGDCNHKKLTEKEVVELGGHLPVERYTSERRTTMKLGCIIYHHRFGIDVLPFQISNDREVPEITNELLRKLGVSEPELGEREDEYAEWYYLYPLDHWPVLKGAKR
jgi:hypothetical protein